MQSVEELSDDVKALYSKGEDGIFYLTGITGVASKEKVDEFRNNNVSLTEKLKLFDNVDVDKYKSFLKKEDELRGKKTITVNDLEAKVKEATEKRVKEMKAEFTTEKNVLSGKNSIMQQQLEALLVDNEVRTASGKHKVLDTAIEDVIFRAKSTFKVEDGKVVGYDKDDNKLYDKTGENLLSIGTWVEQLGKVAPHLFAGSVGGGLQNSSGGAINRSNMSAVQKINAGLK